MAEEKRAKKMGEEKGRKGRKRGRKSSFPRI